MDEGLNLTDHLQAMQVMSNDSQQKVFHMVDQSNSQFHEALSEATTQIKMEKSSTEGGTLSSQGNETHQQEQAEVKEFAIEGEASKAAEQADNQEPMVAAEQGAQEGVAPEKELPVEKGTADKVSAEEKEHLIEELPVEEAEAAQEEQVNVDTEMVEGEEMLVALQEEEEPGIALTTVGQQAENEQKEVQAKGKVELAEEVSAAPIPLRQQGEKEGEHRGEGEQRREEASLLIGKEEEEKSDRSRKISPLAPRAVAKGEQEVKEGAEEVAEAALEESVEELASVVEQKEAPTLRELAIPPEEAQQIIQALDNVMSHTHVQAPVSERIPPQVLEGLKTENPQLYKALTAKSVEGLAKGLREARPIRATPQPQVPSRAEGGEMKDKIEQMRERIVQQVRFQLSTKFNGRTGETKMLLRPELLGTVRVRMEHEANRMVAHFIVENNTVREVLQRNVPQLTESLLAHGIEVENVEVEIAGEHDTREGGAFASMEEQEMMREWIASFGSAEVPTAETEQENISEDHDPDQVINILA